MKFAPRPKDRFQWEEISDQEVVQLKLDRNQRYLRCYVGNTRYDVPVARSLTDRDMTTIEMLNLLDHIQDTFRAEVNAHDRRR